MDPLATFLLASVISATVFLWLVLRRPRYA